jgi:nuclear GTP-binding protein
LNVQGAVRAEKLPDPTDFAAPILARAKAEHLKRLYNVADWANAEDFLGMVAK